MNNTIHQEIGDFTTYLKMPVLKAVVKRRLGKTHLANGLRTNNSFV